MEWVTEYSSPDGLLTVWNLDGISWHDAKLPPRFHRCRAQTMGDHNFSSVERCACGAIRLDGRVWMDRNERRKSNRASAQSTP